MGLRVPLTLVSAPAGYGKTTLLSEWRNQAGAAWAAAWLSLDEGDNDPRRLLSYLLAAIENALPGTTVSALPMLDSTQLPPLEAVFTSLLHGLDQQKQELALVLDDVHAISNPSIHEGVAFILDHLPPHIHLVILTRADPPLPLARMRLRRQLVEIRAEHLRFVADETASFLTKSMGLALLEEDIAVIESRTEGWIGGLQLAALSMQGRQDPHPFIQAFAGSHHYIIDYLAEEVLSRQPPRIQEFLLHTAVLGRLCDPLCNALTGRQDGQQMLEALEQANLFVIPLDDERAWYRYHHLFAGLLRDRLERQTPELLPRLHLKASQWYAGQGYFSDALEHALAGKFFDQAANLLEQEGSKMLANSAWGQLLAWLRHLPGELLHERPGLELYYSWSLVLTNQLEEIEVRVNKAMQAIERSTKSEPVKRYWRGQVAAILGRAAYLGGDIRQAIAHSQQAMALAEPDDTLTHSLLAMNLGLSYIATGDFAAAEVVLEEGRQTSLAAGSLSSAFEAAGTLAQVQEARGRLRQAAQTYTEILRLGQGQTNATVMAAHVNHGNLLYEWYDLEFAGHHLQIGLEIARQLFLPDGSLFALIWLARVRLAQGSRASAMELLHQADNEAKAFPLSILRQVIDAWLASLALQTGDLDAVNLWAASHPAPSQDNLLENILLRRVVYRLQARWLIAQGHFAEALQLLARYHEVATRSGLRSCEIEALSLKALALSGRGELASAIQALNQALRLAEPEGFVGTFAELGPSLAGLMQRNDWRGVSPDYLQRLRAALARQGAPGHYNQAALIEPISERELEVLQLLADGHSNQDIAKKLVIAPGTVKKHLNNIFGKLGVESRTQCVAKARQLHLLDS